jgi:hypothetical protein
MMRRAVMVRLACRVTGDGNVGAAVVFSGAAGCMCIGVMRDLMLRGRRGRGAQLPGC